MAKKKKSYSLDTLRHSLSHLMALALKRIYGEVLYGIGPTTENGFYYDVEIKNKTLSDSDLGKIEEEMRKLIKEKIPFVKKEISLKEAKILFKKLDQKYKLELLKDLEKFGTTDVNVIANKPAQILQSKIRAGEAKQSKRLPRSAKASLAMTGSKTVTIYQLGDFIDLCRGPHVKNTEDLPLSFKLTKVSGAYWRGDEKNPMLLRINGIAFNTQKELEDYLLFLKEAEERDHRFLGEKLDLFHIDDNLGPGLILWHPKGAILKRIVENYALEEYLKNGYYLVNTPHIALSKLWQISGHLDFYRSSMYPQIHLKEIAEDEKTDYQLKPMNCPFHILIYKNKIRSYKDLPLRYTELGTVYRYEKSGTLHGLVRVRGFTQDDAHIWCTLEQLEEEIEKTFNLALKILKRFGFKDYEIYLSTRPKEYIGKKSIWDKATKALEKTLKKNKIKYFVDKGGGAFYGPKIDIKIKDAIGRSWQCTTIQVDFNLPQRFEMFYIDKNGKKQQPIMIHRALLGSLERFLGVLIEHYKGDFPLWLAPVQIIVLPVLEENYQYGLKIKERLSNEGFRVEVDSSKETLSKRIREAEIQKIPYLLVVGKKEEESLKVAVRQRGKGDLGQMEIEKFIEELKKMIEIK